MKDERFTSLVSMLKLTDDERRFADSITVQSMLSTGIDLRDLHGDDEESAKLTCFKVVARLYDMHMGYTLCAGPVVVVCQHSCYTELPISKSSKIALMKYGRLELRDLWTTAIDMGLYDVMDVLNHMSIFTTIRYRYKMEDAVC